MNKLLKILSTAAVVASLTPYRVSTDEETGSKTYQALLWKLTSKPAAGEDGKRELSLDISFHSPIAKEDEEAHLFADDLTVDYDAPADGTVFPEEEPVVEAVPVQEPVQPSEPVQEDAQPAEDAPKAE